MYTNMLDLAQKALYVFAAWTGISIVLGVLIGGALRRARSRPVLVPVRVRSRRTR